MLEFIYLVANRILETGVEDEDLELFCPALCYPDYPKQVEVLGKFFMC